MDSRAQKRGKEITCEVVKVKRLIAIENKSIYWFIPILPPQKKQIKCASLK